MRFPILCLMLLVSFCPAWAKKIRSRQQCYLTKHNFQGKSK